MHRKYIGLFFGATALLLPAAAMADTYPRIIIRTQTESGDRMAPASTVRVEANDPSLSTAPANADTLLFAADFDGEERTVTARPGSFEVTVHNPHGDYRYAYSDGCDGTLSDNETEFCTITAREDDNNLDGTLWVYVTVNCPSGTHCPTYRVEDFRIRVNGNDPSPSSFNSSSGTRVLLDSGYFSVSASDTPAGWHAQYSGTCSGTIGRNQSLSCTVTFTPTGHAHPGPTYPGGALTCSPAYQAATLGSSVTFSASGGSGVYSWGTRTQGFVGGHTFVWRTTTPGPHTVAVSSGGQTAMCTVQVVGSYGGGYPQLPKTGYPPIGLQLALAALLLSIAGYVSYPYVRNAFTHFRG